MSTNPFVREMIIKSIGSIKGTSKDVHFEIKNINERVKE